VVVVGRMKEESFPDATRILESIFLTSLFDADEEYLFLHQSTVVHL
jgi:hypothetical protein